MTEPNEPDKKVEETESTGDEAPIELKEEAADETEDSDEIIDLVDVAEAQDDDEIIDLVNAAEEISPKDDAESSVDDVSEPAEDDVIIDLTESISDTPQEIGEIGEPILDAAEDSQEFEDISEFDENLIEEAVDFDDEFDTEAIASGVLKDDFADSLGVEFDSNEDTSEDLFEADKVSDEQVEAALERVIKKVFYEKIDRLLAGAIEKTVITEIERLKKALLEDSPDGEK